MSTMGPNVTDDPEKYFASSPEEVVEADHIPKKGAGVDRRAVLAELTALSLPLINHIRWMFSGRTPRSESVEKRPYPFTDVTHELQTGGTFRNIGVHHNMEDLEIDQKHLSEAIKAADIVLLEGGQDEEVEENYFSLVRNHAIAEGKTVYDIDNYRHSLVYAQYEGSLALPAVIGAVSAADDLTWKGKPEMQVTRQGSRRTFLRWLAGASLAAHLPVYHVGTDPETYPAHVVSYPDDGRTVKMFTNVRDSIKEFPGKNILVISGNLHALGIEYYAQHLQEYEAKKAIYDKTYERVYGLPKKQLN